MNTENWNDYTCTGEESEDDSEQEQKRSASNDFHKTTSAYLKTTILLLIVAMAVCAALSAISQFVVFVAWLISTNLQNALSSLALAFFYSLVTVILYDVGDWFVGKFCR